MSVFLPTNTQQIGDEDEEVKSVIPDLMLEVKEVYITHFPESQVQE
jgi:division protein CdvB (Snf7/Vps24/ESCRT-III family)